MLGAVKMRRAMRGPLRPSWSVEYETLSRFLHHYSKRATVLPLFVQRRALDLLRPSRGDAHGTEVTRVDADGVRGAWIRPRGADPTRVLYYLHGGGYSIGSIESHQPFVTRLARLAGVTAFAIDYRLAPEHPFPAQRDDARTAWRWLLRQGVDPARVVIGGESAGGGLTLALLLSLRDAGEPLPKAAAVISPWVDLTLSSPSIDENARYDYLARHVLETYVARVTGGEAASHPLLSPVFADLSRLPPLFVQAGGAEAIVDDARTLVERASAAGTSVEYREHPDQLHAFPLFMNLPASRTAIDELAAFLRGALDPQPR